ncbi:putative ribonuclease H-like domain-containing protein [Tanacetum coccineum]
MMTYNVTNGSATQQMYSFSPSGLTSTYWTDPIYTAQSPMYYYGAPAMYLDLVPYAPAFPQAFHNMTLRDPGWNMDTGASSYLGDNTCILTALSNQKQSHDEVYGFLKGSSRNSRGKRLAISMVEEARVTAVLIDVNAAQSKLVLLENFNENYSKYMDQDSAHMVAASKVPMLKPVEFELWRMRVEQYIQMIDYALWEVIENDKAQRRLEVKARSTLMMGIPNEHQLKFNSIKDAKLLMEAVEKRFGGNAGTKKTQRNLLKQQYENFTASSSEMLDQTFDRLQNLVSQLELLDEKLSQEDVNQKLLRSLSPEWNTHAIVWRNKAKLEIMRMDDLYNNLKVYEPEVKGMYSLSSSTQNMAFVSSSNNNTSSFNEAVNVAHGVTTASTQVNAANSKNIDNLSDAVICSFFASQPNRRKLTVNSNETISFDKSKVKCYNYHKRGHFAREYRALRNQDNKNKESSRRSVPIETSNSTALVSCDGLGRYDWSDQAEEGPKYALMAYSSSSSDSEVSNDSTCYKSCLETVKLLKSQYDQLLKDFNKSKLMVLGYKIGLESVEERLEFYKKNESIYEEKIKGLKWDIQVGEITIGELRKKLEIIVDNCKKGLGYNVVPPPYAGNFMPLKPDLSFIGLDKFVNEHAIENCKAKSSEEKPKVVKKNNDAPIIEERVSNSEEENVSQTKTEKKTVKPSIAKIEFVKPKQQEKAARKTVKQVEKHWQNTHSLRGNQRNWNNMMSQKLGSNFKMFNKMDDMLLLEGTPKEIKSQKNVPLKLLIDESQVLLRVPRKNNMYSVDLKNIVPKRGLTCLFAKATSDESKLWHRRLGHLNFKTMNKLVKGNLVRGLPSKLFENDQTCVACQKGKQHRAFSTKDETSDILKSFITGIENIVDHKVKYSVAKTPQQNGVVERRNRILIEATRTMLADSKLPTTFWAKAVNSKFDSKADEGFFVGYSLNNKAFRVFNSRTRILEENLHIRFSENTPNAVGSGLDWLFDINALTRTINHEPIVADDGFKPSSDDEKKVNEDLRTESESKDQEKDANVNNTNSVNVKHGELMTICCVVLEPTLKGSFISIRVLRF